MGATLHRSQVGQSMKTNQLSSDDLSRLIDALEGTSHLDTTEAEQQHTDDLLKRLVNAFDISSDRQFTLLP